MRTIYIGLAVARMKGASNPPGSAMHGAVALRVEFNPNAEAECLLRALRESAAQSLKGNEWRE